MISRAILLCSLAIVAAALSNHGADAQGTSASFTMPSKNIECIYTPAGGSGVYKPADGGPELSCDRAEPAYVRITLGRSGPARRYDNVGDRSCCGVENPVAYGTSWSQGPFVCQSAQTGLTCTRDSHGFSISRETISIY